ncbi:1,4-dihydroxy-2-naphthoyl-CoA hydrolase [Leptolyngbya sp. 'hensonii']|uniref:acyl-CoA thioesterase n=1 Tax=Leptolyngbya sp. 'hensonii' TaxID=1922337 RepID=UPI00094F9355|nr:thioesterase family protein [Leptolyngbya sp. 'hensonii']OLP20193.1 1,4-dihydroxy-2-naphthoyl-CoA hydrolase [Leptolyngbya sp. 'hensonii']
MPFIYQRTIHFQETDAAGVVYFANLPIVCHEAYEASLAETGISLRTFFNNSGLAVPLTHVQVDFFRPLYCGDRIQISLTPKQLTESKFEITYDLSLVEVDASLISKALTRHACIHPGDRTKIPIPPFLMQWLERFTHL